MIAAFTVISLLLVCTSCATQEVPADFYQGLQKNNEKDHTEALAFFDKALNSPNPHIRTAASAEILRCFYNDQEIPAPIMNRAKNSAPPSWAAAFAALAAEPDELKKRALAFLLSSGQDGTPFSPAVFPDDAALYALRECQARNPDLFSQAELAAINGNISASVSSFSQALNYFRVALENALHENGEPALFFQHPDLIARLGRSFQYSGTGAANEGIELFLKWESIVSAGGSGLSPAEVENIRYRLLFFAGRMARQTERYHDGIAFFQQALPFAPDAEQSDACAWYILDTALRNRPEIFFSELERLMPAWHDKAYFNDVLDMLCNKYAAQRHWADIAAIFPLIRQYADEASIAKYAYIIARAMEEGLPAPDAASSAEYMEIAYQSGQSALYYRLMSATALGKPFMEMQRAKPSARRTHRPPKPESAAMEFLKGFFSYDAAEHAPAYIRALEKELSPGEKQYLAGALDKAGLHRDSMRLLSLCADDVQFDRTDYELYYPRPFRDYVEKYAQENALAPELLYGLIRTESAFQSAVVSRAGAVGLTQLLPSTAGDMISRIRRQGGPDYSSETALRDPEANIHIGAVYLRYLMDRMDSPLLALLAYNGGMNRIRRWRNVDPGLSEDMFMETIEFSETREYGRKVLAAQAMYKALYYSDDARTASP